MEVKPIPTKYKGYRFRSRLEARWACFFDMMDCKYEYEPEGWQIGDRPYLPDFYLPAIDCYIEVKGSLSPEDKALFERIGESRRDRENDKGIRLIVVGTFDDDPEDLLRQYCPGSDDFYYNCITYDGDWFSTWERFFWQTDDWITFRKLQMAWDFARGTRFEHGEDTLQYVEKCKAKIWREYGKQSADTK